MALGNNLRSYQKVDFALLNAGNKFCRLSRPADSIASDNFTSYFGEKRRRFFGDPFHAWPAGRHAALSLTFRAGLGWAPAVATMMAIESVGETMGNKPGAAIGTFKPMAAEAAER